MKESWLHYQRGYVVIQAEHPSPERFLNMCTHHGIKIYDLEIRGETLTMKLEVSDFFKLRPLVRKCRLPVRIKEKRGLPFFFYRNKKRKAFFVGAVLGMGMIYLLSGHIWNIHVEGNVRNSTPVILEFLESQNVTHGIPVSKVSCRQIAASIRENFPDITWVSAKIVGTRLLLTVQEAMEQEEEGADVPEEVPCNLVAQESGTIVEMITRRGVPQVFPGDTCEKGEILVSGILEIKNDNQEVVRLDYVPAQADILLERTVDYEDSFSMEHEVKNFTGKNRFSYGFWLGPWYLETGFFQKKTGEADQVTEEMPLYFTENFRLPVTFFRRQELSYEKENARYTEAEAKTLALGKLENFQKNLMEKGVQIYKNHVTIETDERICRSHGTIVIGESVGEQVPIDTSQTDGEQAPAERTTLDEPANH